MFLLPGADNPISSDPRFTELQGHIADRHVLGCSIHQGPQTKHAKQYGFLAHQDEFEDEWKHWH